MGTRSFHMKFGFIAILALGIPTVFAYNETLTPGNTTQFAIKEMSYGVHIFALSKDGYVVHQVAHPDGTSVGYWMPLPNSHQGSTPKDVGQTYDSDAAVGQNDDGRLELIIRSHNSL